MLYRPDHWINIDSAGKTKAATPSDFHQVFFFLGKEFIDLGDIFVGQ
jgi:hypothetical protein